METSSGLDAVPSWVLTACRPMLPMLESLDVGLDEQHLVARLAQLAAAYAAPAPNIAPDYMSAALYATLALALDPLHTVSRRILADAMLHGGPAADLFHFRPSATAGAAASASVSASAFVPAPPRPSGTLAAPAPLAAGSNDHAAQAALHVLEHGGQATFVDAVSASLYAEACRRLGRFREGEEALAWTLQSQASGSGAASASSVPCPPPLPTSNRTSPADAQHLCQAASLALAGNRQGDAAYAYRSALEHHDRWCWGAWTGYCDAGTDLRDDENTDLLTAAKAFGPLSSPTGHRVNDFLPPDLESRHEEMVALENELAQLEKDSMAIPSAGPRPPPSTAGRTKAAAAVPMSRTTSSTNAPPSSRPQIRASAVAATSRLTGGTTFQRPGSRVTGEPNATATSKRTRSSAQAPSTTMQNTTRMNTARAAAAAPPADRTRRNRPPSSVGGSVKGTDNDSEVSTVRRSTRILSSTSRPGTATSRTVSSSGTGLATRSRTTTNTSATTVSSSTRASLRPRPTSTASTAPSAAGARPGRPAAATVTHRVAARTRHPLAASSAGDGDGAESHAALAQARYEALLQLKEELSRTLRQAVVQAKRWTRVDRAVRDLLVSLGEAYRCVRMYHARRAVWILRSSNADSGVALEQVREEGETMEELAEYKVLDPRVLALAPVQVLLGRAYHDLAWYADAERHFLRARRADPTLLSGMDIYSLTLFHLHREVALAALAQECLLLDKASAVANVVAGNTFSLQREHGVALRFFRRAMTVAPGYAYAYTLAGYEALELGQRDDAKAFFRAAVRCDRRHWNAWSGLGQISLLEGHWAYAEFHYTQAVEINPQNAVLWDLCGWVREMGEDKHTAIHFYNRALSLDAAMPMTLLKRGELLAELGQVRQAHEDFLQACSLAPHEARVHILLAKSYMRLAGGHFAELEPGGTEEEADGGEADDVSLDAAGFVRRHMAAGGAGRGRAKAVGEAAYVRNSGYEGAIAHHLAVAADLDPRSVRAIKAMGEGLRAAVQSASKRRGGLFDPAGMASVSVSASVSMSLAAAAAGGGRREPEDTQAQAGRSGGRFEVHADDAGGGWYGGYGAGRMGSEGGGEWDESDAGGSRSSMLDVDDGIDADETMAG